MLVDELLDSLLATVSFAPGNAGSDVLFFFGAFFVGEPSSGDESIAAGAGGGVGREEECGGTKGAGRGGAGRREGGEC